MQIHNAVITGSFSYNGADLSNVTSSNQSSASLSTRVTQIEQVYATTGSNSFRATQSITGSLTVTGQIVAQTLNVQQVTSSIVYSSGSNDFGCDLNSRQTFTGSIYITGSLIGLGASLGGQLLVSYANPDVDGIKLMSTTGTNAASVMTTNTGGNFYFGKDASNGSRISGTAYANAIWAENSYPLVFGVNNGEKMRINSSGSLGIGTNDPTNTLTMLASSTCIGKGVDFVNYSNVSQVLGQLTFEQVGDTLALTHKLSGGGITFSTNNTERMRILSNGQVLIGDTCSPSTAFKIDSNGFINIRNGYGLVSRTTSTELWGLGDTDFNVLRSGVFGIATFTARDMLFATSNTERMRIVSGGAIAISSAPTTYGIFNIKSNSATSYAGLNIYANGNNNFIALNHNNNVGIIETEFGTGGTGHTPLTFVVGGSERMRIATNGDITLGITSTYDTAIIWRSDFTNTISGRIYTSGEPRVHVRSGESGGVYLTSGATSWTANTSDERKKKNFETTQGLAEVLQIEPVKYHFNWDEDSSPKRLGFKAQNILPLIPEMVSPNGEKWEDESDVLTITPDYLIPVLVKAIQDLKAELDDYKATHP